MDSERRHWPGATRTARGLADRQGGYSGMYAQLIASGIQYFDDPSAIRGPERPLFAARVAAGAASRALAREGYWPRATHPQSVAPPAEQAPSSASSLKVGSGDPTSGELKAPPRRWGSLDQDAEESGDDSAPAQERRPRRATPALKRPPRLWKKQGGSHGIAAGGESAAGPEDGGGHGQGDQVVNQTWTMHAGGSVLAGTPQTRDGLAGALLRSEAVWATTWLGGGGGWRGAGAVERLSGTLGTPAALPLRATAMQVRWRAATSGGGGSGGDDPSAPSSRGGLVPRRSFAAQYQAALEGRAGPRRDERRIAREDGRSGPEGNVVSKAVARWRARETRRLGLLLAVVSRRAASSVPCPPDPNPETLDPFTPKTLDPKS